MTEIRLCGVTKTFGKDTRPVVDGADLVIEEGQFVVLLGPSGCGKTTTLRMIAGLEKVTTGQIFFGDELVNDIPGVHRNVGMVFQNYALYPHMTVFDNLAFGLRSRSVGRGETKRLVTEILELLELDGLAERRPKELSGGQRQRVALGRALVRRPAVFLMDEPLSNLDANLREQMRMELARLHERLRITTIYVTHDQGEALTLADVVVVMERGHILQVDHPAVVYAKPRDTFVARFIGSPGMNLWTVPLGTSEGPLAAGASLRLPAGMVEGMARHGVERITLGVRPEHLQICEEPPEPARAFALQCRAEICEQLGSHGQLHGRLGPGADGAPVVARVPSDYAPARGELLWLSAPSELVHVYDAESGGRLELNDAEQPLGIEPLRTTSSAGAPRL